MPVRNEFSWSTMISAFSWSNRLEDAIAVYEMIPDPSVVSRTAMFTGYAQNGGIHEAIALFACANIGALEMGRQLHSLTVKAGCQCNSYVGVKPNSSTVTGFLVTCGSLGARKLGKQIHCLIFKLGLDADVFVGNSLIAMYCKCGCKDGFWVFDEMYEFDIVTWNTILIGCAQNGLQSRAIGGSLCLYGGPSGHLHEAEELIENMPIEPDSVVWAALLGGCRIHQNVELGRKVAERLFQLEPQKTGNYVLLSNIYASLGMWEEVEEVRKLMRDRGVAKEPGISWIQIKNKLLSFVNGDKRQDHIEEVYTILKEFYGRLREVGYVPDTNFVLHDVEEEQKENALLYHSEKLAIVYGLLNTPHGTSIQIMKNLRICGDCHSFTKFLSKVTQREIVIRDGNRFHHSQDGSCSCGDYW
ncbi:hypothetical protein IFM89_025601 [Coptis chinensis]|uniref:DYW domain-containing protein n=1 Tax=Coptis chinensis TaxID=261450 RepID=A0A835IDM6_9MAGN|nr:hypothetical protein IFM89_025601 [Coptis chinensis]